MVNKLLGWAVVGVMFIVYGYAYNYIDTAVITEMDATRPALMMFILVAYIMGRSAVPEGNLVTTIVESIKDNLMNILWLTLAVVVYRIIATLIGGDFSVDMIVSAATVGVLSTTAAVLVMSAVNAAMKD